MTTVSRVRKARTGVWRRTPDLRPTCSRSANAAWPAKRRVISLTAPRVNLVIARGNVIGGLPSWGLAPLMAQIQRLGGTVPARRGDWPVSTRTNGLRPRPRTPENGVLAEGALPDTRSVEYLAERLAAVPGVVAVTLGGSRAVGAAVAGSDWDFGLYYRGGLDPADGYVAGIATYVLAGELALGQVLAGELPRPAFPPRLLQTAPAAWFRLAAGALSFADVYAGRQDRVACLANLCQAVLATGQGRLAAAGVWVLNEKRLTERAGLDAIQDRLAQPGPGLDALVSDVRARLGLDDPVWAVRPADRTARLP
jgi:hypothetical protein